MSRKLLLVAGFWVALTLLALTGLGMLPGMVVAFGLILIEQALRFAFEPLGVAIPAHRPYTAVIFVGGVVLIVLWRLARAVRRVERTGDGKSAREVTIQISWLGVIAASGASLWSLGAHWIS